MRARVGAGEEECVIKRNVTLSMAEVRERLARSFLEDPLIGLPRGQWLTVLTPGADEVTLEMTLLLAEGKAEP